jgi:hypothetical protein
MTDLKKVESSADISKLVAQKLEISSKIRSLRADMGKVNEKLHNAGAAVEVIACW